MCNYQQEIIRLAAEAGAKVALDTLAQEREKELESRADARLRNTKLLLQNYRMFKDHIKNAVFEVEQLDENAIDILDLMCNRVGSEKLYVESIKKSVSRTAIIMKHVTDMLFIYEAYCSKTGKPEDMRHYRVVDSLYISDTPATVSEIAKRERIDNRTVYKDVDAATEKLSALIFGIDGLKRS